jgi:hypothetical protein
MSVPLMMPNDQICIDILHLLYNLVSDDPESSGVDRAIIQATLHIPQTQMDNSVTYLAKNGLVSLSGMMGTRWTFAKITGDGIDVLENKERYAEKYPFSQLTSSQAPKQPQDSLRQTVELQVSFEEQVAIATRQASDQVLAAQISKGDKRKIEKQLKSLEKELLKARKADLNRIQKDWLWLKKNANWATSALAPAVLEAAKKALSI